jgi:hypothetical protein
MSTSAERLFALVRTLADKTEAGDASWKKSDSATAFIYSLASGSVIIASLDNDGNFPYEVSLLNDQGEVIESRSSSGRWNDDDEGQWDDALRRLYFAARGSALNIDGVLNSMLSSLGVDPNTVGPVVPPRNPAGDFPSSPTDDDIPF